MIFLVGSKIDRANIHASLGKPEYSYYFLLREFLPALERLGRVVVVESAQQIDGLFDQYRADGHEVVFLSFSPPHQTPLGFRCPTIPLFAWEFDSLPSVNWEGDPRNDWRYVFQRVAGAIATSSAAAALVRQEMGESYPVIALPAPTWERFKQLSIVDTGPHLGPRQFTFGGIVFDSPLLGLSADGLVQPPQPVVPPALTPELQPDAPPEPLPPSALEMTVALLRGWWREMFPPAISEVAEVVVAEPAPVEPPTLPKLDITVASVVFTTVLNPGDARKNWLDIITAFCWTFKDTTDATLIVKMTHHDLEHYRVVLMTLLSRLAPFQCRVLVLHGFLDDAEYLQLIEVSNFYVNASTCEGLCIPLMEFLSCGNPAIAPKHTAMADYLDSDMAFLLEFGIEPCCWPHDPTGMLFSHFHRVSWQSLANAYGTAYLVAKTQPEKYRAMSRHALAAMPAYCAGDHVSEKLAAFLQNISGCNNKNMLMESAGA